MKHHVSYSRDPASGETRATCTCGWSAADEDRTALSKRAAYHDLQQLPDIPEKVPFKSGLKDDLYS